MDVSTALAYPTRDPHWPRKIALYVLAMVGCLVIVGIPFTLGYQAAIARQVRSGVLVGLPEWRLSRQFFADAGRLFVSGLIWNLPVPLSILALGFTAIVLEISAQARQEPHYQQLRDTFQHFPWLFGQYARFIVSGADLLSVTEPGTVLLNVLTIGLQLYGNLVIPAYIWLLVAFHPAIAVLAIRNGVVSSLNVRAVWQVARSGGTYFIFAALFPTVAGYVSILGCVFLFIGFFIASALVATIEAFNYGVVWAKFDSAGYAVDADSYSQLARARRVRRTSGRSAHHFRSRGLRLPRRERRR